MTLAFVVAFVREMGLGLLLGLAGGFAIVRLVNRLDLESGLYPIVVLAASLVLFGIAGALHCSGFLAVYVAGLYAGNRRLRQALALRRFQDGMTWLAQIGMFVVFGLLATPSEFPRILIPGIALGVFLIFVARPIAVWLCLWPFRFQREETTFIAWVGLRGAVSLLLGILPLMSALPAGQDIFNAAFIVVLVSLIVQGWTIRPMARQLGLIIPPTIGPVEKVELELPGTAHHELVVYHVVADSPVARGERIPRWARPSLVVRKGQSMRPQYRRPHRGGRPRLSLHRAAQHPAARPALRQPGARSRRTTRISSASSTSTRATRSASWRRPTASSRRATRRRRSASTCWSGSAARPRSATACRSDFWSSSCATPTRTAR